MTSDRLEFNVVYNDFFPKITRFLSRVVGPSEAQDLAQAVFLKVSKHLPELKDRAAMSAWIYRIASNAATDTLRTRRATPDPSHKGYEDPKELPNDEQTLPSAEQKLIRHEMTECISEMVDTLPASYRIVLALSEFEGMKNAEIADILGITLDTVKIRLHRARGRLKTQMKSGCTLYRDDRDELACDRKGKK